MWLRIRNVGWSIVRYSIIFGDTIEQCHDKEELTQKFGGNSLNTSTEFTGRAKERIGR